MRTVIFDLDGTLADTSGDLIAAANHCFDGMGLEVRLDPKADAGTALRGGRAMLTLGLERAGRLDTATVDRWYSKLLDAYDRDIDHHTVFFDGAMEAVEALKVQGFRVGICTNKPEGLAEKLLTRLGVRDAFHSLVGADTLPTRKPDPAPYRASVERAGGTVAQSLIVGDTTTDLKTARAVGVPCILVSFGPGQEEVASYGADAFLDSFADLPSLAARLIG